MKSLIGEIIKRVLGSRYAVQSITPVSGGDINLNYRIIISNGTSYFIKLNRNASSGMFCREAEALDILRESETFRIPGITGYGIFNDTAYLLMEYIPRSRGNTNSPVQFGRLLAGMHRHENERHGWHTNNYIGTLHQKNSFHGNWLDFYIENRLKPQVDLAVSGSSVPAGFMEKAEKYYEYLRKHFPPAAPSLLHGDLWSGNYFYDTSGYPVLIDPASYYGNREMDLAMMHLFGGFPKEIFDTYHREFPLEKDWKFRIRHYQLYPLLVHLNLFGKQYLPAVERIINVP